MDQDNNEEWFKDLNVNKPVVGATPRGAIIQSHAHRSPMNGELLPGQRENSVIGHDSDEKDERD